MPDYFEKLGVKKIIHAYDTLTELTGSVMPLEVQRAAAQAAKTHVYLRELHGAAGEYIAKRLR